MFIALFKIYVMVMHHHFLKFLSKHPVQSLKYIRLIAIVILGYFLPGPVLVGCGRDNGQWQPRLRYHHNDLNHILALNDLPFKFPLL